jgi:hypothetical protein
MEVRQQPDSLRRYSPLEEKEEPDKKDDDGSKNLHTHTKTIPLSPYSRAVGTGLRPTPAQRACFPSTAGTRSLLPR